MPVASKAEHVWKGLIDHLAGVQKTKTSKAKETAAAKPKQVSAV